MKLHALRARGKTIAVALTLLLTVTGCLAVPLGDPAKSTADSRLFGVWEWRDSHVNRAVIRPWDSHTFVIDVLTGDPTADGAATVPRSRNVFKAWLTDVAGQTFLTLQPIDTIGNINGDDRRPSFIVTRIKLEGTTMAVSGVQPDFKPVQDAKSSAELERAIATSLDNPKLFAPPIVLTRWTADQMKGLDKLQDAFRELKQP